MTAIRRKRDDDSTIRSNSQCSASQGGDPSLHMDASQASMAALDASTIATDASLPRRQRKRRRTTIVDQLQHINISNGEVGVPNQILEQAVVDDNSQTLTSSESEGEDDDHERSQILPLSNADQAQRSVIKELVFGRPPAPGPSNPVDRKIQSMVQQSLDNVQKGEHPLFMPNETTESQDDMTIEPVYTRPSDPSFFNSPPAAAGMELSIPPPSQPPQRQRSNSLPEGLMDELEPAPMEIS